MKLILLASFLLSFNTLATGMTDAFLKENIGTVITKTREILLRARAKGNPYAGTMLRMIRASRIEFTDQDTVLAEYIREEKKILFHKVPEAYIVFNREFMLHHYYPAVLVHEATHDIVRVTPRTIETLHGKEFARVCLSVIKDAGIPLAMRDGWARGMDFGISKYLEFQLRLSEKNSPFEVVDGDLGVSMIRLRNGVLFPFQGKDLVAGNNVVLHVQDLRDLEFDARTQKVNFTGKLKNVLPLFDGLPLDVTLPKGTELELLKGITVRANRDSLLRAFHFDTTGALWGLNLMKDFPGLINASLSVSSPSVRLPDVAGVSFRPASLALDLVLLENNSAPVRLPLGKDGGVTLSKIRGTLSIGRDEVLCSPQEAHGDFEAVNCRMTTGDGKAHSFSDSLAFDRL